ncbi:ABC-2 family transporter protein [Corynebacterium occultum]|uniref:ABC-2 family transporter protein n=1 Tax=Corynebacterium occultum TaxID=2675219 RepID=A0A6B8VS94_9CORY|nr:ABC transporter permease [Corynebacterium occultum]QGU08452.1 ABC-2 family transporter protein [Corynebacterium occultum]
MSSTTYPPEHSDPEAPSVETAAAAAAKREKAEKIGRYVAMFLMPVLMVGMMITGYLGAMHSPSPNDMPIAVTGNTTVTQAFTQNLVANNPGAVDVEVAADEQTARNMVFDREVTAAVSLSGSTATLYTASGAGAQLGSTVTGLVAPEVLALDLELTTEDLAPLPEQDISGLAAMFLTTALVMAGYLPFSVLISNSPELLRFRRALPLLAGWSALIAALAWLVTGPMLGVVGSEHTTAVLGISWLGVFAIGSVQLFFTRLFGPMAVLVGMLFLMVLGMPASNMSFPISTMPSFYTQLHAFLPMPAIGEALRSELYFGGAGAGRHLLVLVFGAIAGLGATLLYDVLKKRKHPAPKPMVINMPSLHGGKRPKSRFWRYASLFVFPFVMVSMMLTVMLGAMHEPSPKDMPVAVVGTTTEQAEQTIAGLEQNMTGLFDLRALNNETEAREQVAEREIVGALILPSAENPTATLLSNQAGSSSAQMVISQVFTQVMGAQQIELSIEDIAPLPDSDSNGTSTMYIAMGWMLSGFMIIIVGANAAPSSRPLRKLLPIAAIYAPFMSAFVWLIADPITGAIDGHFWALLGTGAVAIFCVAMFAAVFERLIGMLSVIPVIGVLMFLGVPASNGALSIYMEPELFRLLHNYLPMPAAVETIRSILYFNGDVVGAHLSTFAIWGVVSLALVFIIDRIKPVSTSTDLIAYLPAEGTEKYGEDAKAELAAHMEATKKTTETELVNA